MSSILNLVRKDLRLLFWPWLGWLGLMLSKLALAGWYLTAENADNGEAMRWNVALTGLAAVMMGVLVAKLVQADAPCRRNAFWRARPISGGGLLVAKATTATVLFGLAPVLATLPWWLWNGMSAVDVAWGAVGMLVLHACVVGPVFLIAAVVYTMGRAVLWACVQFGALICMQALNVYASSAVGETSLVVSRFVLAVAVGAAGVGLLIVWQYLRRQTAAVVAGLVILQGTAQAIWMFSPYDFARRATGWTELRPELGRDVELHAANKVEFYTAKHRGPGPAPVQVRSLWPVTGVPAGLQVNPELMALEVSGVDGFLGKVSNSRAGSWSYQGTRIQLGGMRLKRSAFWPADLAPNQFPVYVGFSLTPEEADRVKADAPSVTVGIRITLERPEVVFKRPLREGDRHVDPHGALKIVRVKPEATGARIVYAYAETRSLLRTMVEKWQSGMIERGSLWNMKGRQDVVFQPEGEALDWLYKPRGGAELRILGVGLWRGEQGVNSYGAFKDRHAATAEEMEKWRARLCIARVVNHEEARFFLRGRTEKFVVENERPR